MKQENTNLFSWLLLWQKFAILGGIAIILVAVPAYLYFSNEMHDISYIQGEQKGVAPMVKTLDVIKELQKHRGLSSAVLGGNSDAAAERVTQQDRVNQSITALDASLAKEQISYEGLADSLKKLKQAWGQIANGVETGTATREQSFQGHTRLIEQAFALTKIILAGSQMDLDPSPDTHYLIQAIFNTAPILAEKLGQARGFGDGLLVKAAREQGGISPDERAQMLNMIDGAREAFSATVSAIDSSIATNPELKARLDAKKAALATLTDGAIKLADSEILAPATPSYSADEYWTKYTEAVDAAYTLIDSGTAALDDQFQKAIEKDSLSLIIIFTIIMIMFVVGSVIAVYITRTITSPVGHLVEVMNKLASGDNQVRANLESFDEIGLLARQFDIMVDQREAVSAAIQKENEQLNNSIIDLLQAVAKLSQRDLTVAVPVTEDITGPVADALNQLTQETAKVLNRVIHIAQDVAKASQQVKAQSDNVIDVAEEEKREVEQAAAELGAASKAMLDIANLALTCNEAAEKAIKNTDKAQETVLGTVQGITAIRDTIRETEKRIKRLGERSQEIGGVINIINNIAERTHTLALNASMHAASAGEAGRGFAVVANEVQKLAENARQATSQISALVNNIQVETADTVTTMNDAISQVVHGTTLAQQAGNEMRETRNTTATLVQLVQRIAAGSRNQAKTSQQLVERTKQIQKNSIKTYDQLQAQGIQTDRLVKLSSGLTSSVSVFTLPEVASEKDGADAAFNNLLIKNLVSDHRLLLSEFTNMMKSAENEDFFVTNNLLSSFEKKLKTHLETELVELYVYLDNVAKMMPIDEKESIKGFSDEMDKIGYTVSQLLTRYIHHPVSAANKDDFIKDFNYAGSILADRIAREERLLYPLYGKYGKMA